MPDCLIGLGSNLGDRAAHMHQAVEALAREPAIRVEAVSSWHETTPIGGSSGQGHYLNGIVRLRSSLSPHELLRRMLRIERQLGRRTRPRWEARTIDLDLLLYDQLVLESDELQLPHPWLAIRRFVLEPSQQVASEMVHPVIGWSLRRLLEHLSSSLPYLALAGSPGAGKTTVLQGVLSQVPGHKMEGTVARKHEAPPGNSSGHSGGSEIQFLRSRAALLDRRNWSNPDELRLSDFWFRQSLAYARLWMKDDQLKQVHDAWLDGCKVAEPCRLLLLVEAPAEQLSGTTIDPSSPSRTGGMTGAQRAQLQRLLRDEAVQPGQGPFLRLDARDPSRAIGDVIAAILAMG